MDGDGGISDIAGLILLVCGLWFGSLCLWYLRHKMSVGGRMCHELVGCDGQSVTEFYLEAL